MSDSRDPSSPDSPSPDLQHRGTLEVFLSESECGDLVGWLATGCEGPCPIDTDVLVDTRAWSHPDMYRFRTIRTIEDDEQSGLAVVYDYYHVSIPNGVSETTSRDADSQWEPGRFPSSDRWENVYNNLLKPELEKRDLHVQEDLLRRMWVASFDRTHDEERLACMLDELDTDPNRSHDDLDQEEHLSQDHLP